MRRVLSTILVFVMLSCAYGGTKKQQQKSEQEIQEVLEIAGELLDEGDSTQGKKGKRKLSKKEKKHQAAVKRKKQKKAAREAEAEVDVASELNIRKGFDWRRDWWKYLLMTVGVLGCLALSMYLCRKLLRMVTFACCLGVGGVCSCFVSPYLLPYVYKLLPSANAGSFMVRFIGYAVTFLVTYFFAMLLMRLIHLPGKGQKEEEQ